MLEKSVYKKISDAARSLASDMRAKKIKLGRMRMFDRNHGPVCALGHIQHRAGLEDTGRVVMWEGNDDLYGIASMVASANDSKDCKKTILAVERFADKAEELSK